jgi:hypothetical protein
VPLRVPAVLLVPLLAACASGRAADPAPRPELAAAPLAPPGALASLASEPLIVLPLQAIAGTHAWRTDAAPERLLIARFDSLFEVELAGRRLGAAWAFPSHLARSARRNPTYLPDPSLMRGAPAILAHLRRPDAPLAEPFASQVRAFAGISNARYAMVPLDLRIDSVTAGGRLAMRLAVVDTRAARVTWWGEVQGTAAPDYAPAVLSDLVQRVADLIIPR